MANAVNLTAWLAIAFGLYSLAAGLAGLVSPDRWRRMLRELDQSASGAFIAGLLVFALGVAIILTHGLGDDWLSILVTVLGWAMAIEGLVLLARPSLITAPSLKLTGRDGALRTYAGASVLIGLFLLLVGFVRLQANL